MSKLGNIWTATFLHPALKEEMKIKWLVLDSKGRETKALVILDSQAQIIVELKDLEVKV